MTIEPKFNPIPQDLIDRLQVCEWEPRRVEVLLPAHVAASWEEAVADHPNGRLGVEKDFEEWLISQHREIHPTR